MPATTEQVLDAIKGLGENQDRLSKRLDDLSKPVDPQARSGAGVFGVPNTRSGENIMSSRGFSYLKVLGAMAGFVDKDEAKIEYAMCEKIRKLYDSYGYRKSLTNSVMLPFASQFVLGDESLAREMRDTVKAGVIGFDPQELASLHSKYSGVPYTKALSWYDETAGGTLVGPPQMGELIELLRNNEVLIQAGARVMAMPPNGRITFPRQTASSTAYWVGESTTVTDSTLGTGDLVLQAKKLGALSKVPNELFRYASVSAEAFLREDLAKVLGIKLDKTLLDSVGSTVEPKGLINYSNITSHTASVTGTNGDTFQPEDVLKMIAKTEEKNAQFKGFITRPLMYAAIGNRRADAVSAADGKGPFVFSMFRDMDTMIDVTRNTPGNLMGYPVYKSTQVSNTRVKGSGTDLSYILGGDFSDYFIALSAAIEFQISTQGDTPFTQDQTWFRGILHADGGPRHEASFTLCDQLLVA